MANLKMDDSNAFNDDNDDVNDSYSSEQLNCHLKEDTLSGPRSNLRQLERECISMRLKKKKLSAKCSLQCDRVENLQLIVDKLEPYCCNDITPKFAETDELIEKIEEDIEFASQLVGRLNEMSQGKCLLKVRLELNPSSVELVGDQSNDEDFKREADVEGINSHGSSYWQTNPDSLTAINGLKKDVSDLLNAAYKPQKEYYKSIEQINQCYQRQLQGFQKPNSDQQPPIEEDRLANQEISMVEIKNEDQGQEDNQD